MPFLGNTTTSFNVDGNNINNGAITSEKIAAGAVVNADVNDTASIAGTKISADFGAQDLIVDTNLLFVDVSEDRVGIGTSSPSAPLHVSGNMYAGASIVATNDTTGLNWYNNLGLLRIQQDTSNTGYCFDIYKGGTNAVKIGFKSDGSAYFASDAEISGLTIGKGNNSHSSNVAIGPGVLGVATGNARNNVGVGTSALADVTDGDGNVAIGATAGKDITTGINNVAIGLNSLSVGTTAGSNVGIGAYSLLSTTSGTENIAIGERSLQNSTSGQRNIGIGGYGLSGVTDGDNNIGIGRDAGNTITAGNDNIIIGKSAGRGITTGSNNVIIGGSTSSTAYATDLANTVVIGPVGTERIRIDSSGRVGIGTTSPSQLLHIRGNSANAGIRLESAGGTGKTYEIRSLTNGLLTVGTTTQNILNISGNNVGIGTTSPDTKAHIVDTALSYTWSSDATDTLTITHGDGTCGINLVSPNNFSNNILFSDGDARAAGFIQYNHSSNFLRFNVNTGDALRIDSSRRLLVGTSTARTNFFNGTWTPQIQAEASTDQACSISLVSSSTGNNQAGLLILGASKSAVGGNGATNGTQGLGIVSFQGNDGSTMIETARIQCVAEGTPSTDNVPARLVFSTNSGSSSAGERFRIAPSGAFGIGGANYGTSGQVLTSQGSGSAPQWADAGGGLYESYAMLRQVLANNTNGGSTVSNTWTTYPINTESFDPDGIVTLSSNTFTLGAGTYRIDARTVFYRTYEVQTRLRNTSDSTDVFVGMSGYASGNDESNFEVTLLARFTITAQKNFQIQYNAAYGRASTGLGNPSNRAQQETYAVIEIFKEA